MKFENVGVTVVHKSKIICRIMFIYYVITSNIHINMINGHIHFNAHICNDSYKSFSVIVTDTCPTYLAPDIAYSLLCVISMSCFSLIFTSSSGAKSVITLTKVCMTKHFFVPRIKK